MRISIILLVDCHEIVIINKTHRVISVVMATNWSSESVNSVCSNNGFIDTTAYYLMHKCHYEIILFGEFYSHLI